MSGTDRVVIGTRGSDLAMWQSNAVAGMLRDSYPGLEVEITIIETKGDRILDVALDKIGDKGLFTKELELALLSGEIDIAVHSLKDLQTELPEGLMLGAVTERTNPEDALVAEPGMTLEGLPEGGTVGTGSLRRRALLLSLRPDLNIVDLRGNVPTRLKKYHDNDWDGVILARAGLERLGLDHEIAQIIPPDVMVPAVCQGALGVEVREENFRVVELLRKIEHGPTRYRAEAERAFLRTLEGGCQAPIGAFATVNGDRLHLTGVYATLDGTRVYREEMEGSVEQAAGMGRMLAERVLERSGGIEA